jgi:hypothetical protein
VQGERLAVVCRSNVHLRPMNDSSRSVAPVAQNEVGPKRRTVLSPIRLVSPANKVAQYVLRIRRPASSDQARIKRAVKSWPRVVAAGWDLRCQDSWSSVCIGTLTYGIDILYTQPPVQIALVQCCEAQTPSFLPCNRSGHREPTPRACFTSSAASAADPPSSRPHPPHLQPPSHPSAPRGSSPRRTRR